MTKRKTALPEMPPPRLSGFAPAIAKALALGLPAQRLSELFGTSASNIYVIAHRQRRHAFTSAIERLPSPAHTIRTGAEDDEVELTPRKASRLESLQIKMDESAQRGRASYGFLKDVAELRALKTRIGYPSESGLLKLAAKLHQHIAWFYVHNGYTTSSIAEALYSARLYELVYK